MSFDGIQFDIDDFVRELDELDRIIYVDRLVTDIDPQSNSVTPVVNLNGTDVTLSAISSASRTISNLAINRIGPVRYVQYQFAGEDDVRWYNIDLVIRALDLGINLLPTGDRVNQRGYATDVTTSLIFDINPFTLPTDARVQNGLIQRLYVDIVTGAETVTPVLVFDDGTTSSLAGITNATRAITEFSIGTTQRLNRIRLDGDFSNSAIVVYDFELDLYISPSHRV